jgi:tryptophanyl-tRNA synthetase
MSRILTGDRPTGALHLGHYFGTLANRVRLQAQGHEVFVVIADYQAITDRDHPGELRSTITGIVLDYLASGLDPAETVIFNHSAVPALNQLMLPFLSLVTMGELTRNPTTKQEIRQAGQPSVTGLMLTYPVHQAADVLFCKPDLVPVGKDQLPHLELTRTIARRFGERFAPVFPLPAAVLGEIPMLTGLDGRKMGKSLGNAIALTDSDDVVAAKVRAARTDAEREITFEPDRRPDVANLLRIGALCAGRSPADLAAEVGAGGAGALKSTVTTAICEFLAPLHERRRAFTAADVLHVVAGGTARAGEIAEHTLAEVRTAMGMDFPTCGVPRESV